MRKITAVFVIAFSLGLFIVACGSSQSTPFTTSTLPEAATLNNMPGEFTEPLVTFGETIHRQGWRLAIPAFSPDGKIVALVSEKVSLWNVETHELIHEFVKPYSNCYNKNVVFSSDGKLLATSIYCSYHPTATGHVLIWNTESGILLHDWEQVFSKNTSKLEGISNSYPASGIAFLPESTVLAFASGNSIELRDVQEDSRSIVLGLGDEMIATDIAISEDGKRLFAFMDFSYPKDPNEIGKKYALQTWDLESERLVDEIDFPETGNTGFFISHFDVDMKLTSTNLINLDYIDETFTVTDLETGDKTNLNYLGDVETYLSQDTRYVVYLPKVDRSNCKSQSIALLDTHLNQSLYTFETSNKDFGTDWCHGAYTIIFNPDNTILAVAHEERVSLWEISSFTEAKENDTP